MFIVVGEKYRDVIYEYIPDWWGVYVASCNKRNKIILKEQKRAKTNKNIHPNRCLSCFGEMRLRPCFDSMD